MSLKKVFHTAIRVSSWSHAVAIGSIALILSACTDYVDKYEGDYKDDYGSEESFKALLDKVDWDWSATCETGDWLWCAIKDGKYMSAATTGAKWKQFGTGNVVLEFLGKDDRAYSVLTDRLPEDLTPFLRQSGGIAVKLEKAEGSFEAGLQINIGNESVSAHDRLVLAYSNEYPDAKLCLRSVGEADNTESEWCWSLEQESAVVVQSFNYKDLEYVRGNDDLSKFIKKEANAVAVVLTSYSEVKTGLNVVALGFGGEPYGQTGTSSSGTATSSSSGNGGTVTSSFSLPTSDNFTSCVPSRSPIDPGESTTWRLVYQDVAQAVYQGMKVEWSFEGGTPASQTIIGNALSEKVSYSGVGNKSATVKVSLGDFATTLTCSELTVTGAATTSSSSKPNSSAASSSSMEGFLWKGHLKSDDVKNDVANGAKWYEYTDVQEGGTTIIQRPEGNTYEKCYGNCGMVWFGDGHGYPFAGIGFDLNQGGGTFDVTGWKGLCIAYKSDRDLLLRLDPEDANAYNHVLPQVVLGPVPKDSSYRIRNFLWENFSDANGGVSAEQIAKELKGIFVAFEGTAGDSLFFNVLQIGSYERCGDVVVRDVDKSQFKRPATAWDYLNPNISYGEITDSRDGQVYKTVKIGEQTWMAQNLNFETSNSYCYENDLANCVLYGRLYTWSEAMDSAGAFSNIGKGCGFGKTCTPMEPVAGICPDGWHLPSSSEWETLFDFTGTNTRDKLKSLLGWTEESGTSANGTDDYGFSAVPGGYRNGSEDAYGMYFSKGSHANFWTATESDGKYAIMMYLSEYHEEPYLAAYGNDGKKFAFSVRCVKTEPIPTSIKSTDLIWYGGNKLTNPTAGTYLKQQNLLSSYTWISGSAETDITFSTPVAGTISDSLIIRCGGGICGKVGSLSEEAYIGFDVDASANLEEWGGVCLTYKASTDSIIMYLGTGGGADTAYSHSISWNLYHVTLPATDVVTTRCFSWLDDFTQYWEGSGNVKIDAYLPHVRDLSFRFTSDVDGAKFNIIAIGTYKDKVSAYNTYMQNKENRTSAWDYLNPAIEYGEFTDERDGQVYKTIDVGNYTWFAQNLNLEYNDGEGNSCPGSDPDSCAKYGRMYTWAAAMDTAGVYSTQALECGAGKVCWLIDPVQGVCPEGWHLPSNAEWRLLVEAAGGESTAAVALKSTKGWVWNSSNTSGTDDLGFSAIPNGPGEYGYFWSGTENSNISGYRLRLMGDATPSTHLGDGTKSTAMNAVRCVKEMNPKPRSGSFTYQGQTYNYVRIGTQTWMAENLNYDIGNNMCYKNDPANCTAYGRMYKWATVVGKTEAECGYGNSCDLPSTGHVQGICPEGWHVPRRAEVETLVEAAGGDDFAGKALKATSTWSDYENNGKVYGNGTDATGFTGYSTGTCSGSSSEPYCNYDGMYTHMWTITENYSGEQAYYFGLLWMGNGVTLLNGDKRDYKNLRCVQDED